jgi:hypothetical protein
MLTTAMKHYGFSGLTKAAALIAVAWALGGASASAQEPQGPPSLFQAREPAALDYENPLVAALHELPEQDLKAFYLECNRAATQTSLGSGDIALCSIGYEILLKSTFGGDFSALLAWSRNQPNEERTSAAAARPPQ